MGLITRSSGSTSKHTTSQTHRTSGSKSNKGSTHQVSSKGQSNKGQAKLTKVHDDGGDFSKSKTTPTPQRGSGTTPPAQSNTAATHAAVSPSGNNPNVKVSNSMSMMDHDMSMMGHDMSMMHSSNSTQPANQTGGEMPMHMPMPMNGTKPDNTRPMEHMDHMMNMDPNDPMMKAMMASSESATAAPQAAKVDDQPDDALVMPPGYDMMDVSEMFDKNNPTQPSFTAIRKIEKFNRFVHTNAEKLGVTPADLAIADRRLDALKASRAAYLCLSPEQIATENAQLAKDAATPVSSQQRLFTREIFWDLHHLEHAMEQLAARGEPHVDAVAHGQQESIEPVINSLLAKVTDPSFV